MSIQTKLAPKANGSTVQGEHRKICVVMVGLPARGKSLIAQKARRYLKWLSIEAEVFNVGDFRREAMAQPPASFFDPGNPEGEKIRRAAAEAAVKKMLEWFHEGKGSIAIFDATNSTKARRRWIQGVCESEDIATLFVESKCDDEDLIMSNILEVKTTSPDYEGQDPEVAAQDFMERIEKYEKVYETIDDEESDLTYLKIMNVGKQVIINRIQDYLQSRVVYYLMNLHIRPRHIWLSRHGESEFNLTQQIGGDANLSPRGEMYARTLPAMIRQSVGDDRPLTVWTSTLKRTIATARFLPKHYKQLQWKALDELDAGVCDGLTYEEIEEMYREDFKARDADKYNYRYRGGESYRDVVTRLEPIIMELERSENILIITHQAVVRCIYAYFMAKPQNTSPWMKVPLHTLFRLTPRAYETTATLMKAGIGAVSTWRPQGGAASHEVTQTDDQGTDGLPIEDFVIETISSNEDDEVTAVGKANGQAADDQATDGQSTGEQATDGQATGEQATDGQATGEQATDGQSTTPNPTSDLPTTTAEPKTDQQPTSESRD